MPRRLVRSLTLALAVLVALGALIGATATRARPGGELAQQTGRRLFLPVLIRGVDTVVPPATVAADLSIRPVPLSQVQRGTDLSVEYRFRNDGSSPLTARFSLFYPSRLINFEWVDAPGDRYISHDNTRVVVEVRNLAAGQTRTGRINFLVLSNAGVGSRVGLYAEYECRSGQSCRSNFAEVEVIANSGEGGSGGTFSMSVSPDRGPPGTAHTFAGSRFRPGETFVTWLNTPTGVLPLNVTGRADNSGNIRFVFGSGQLTQAGFYSMVAHGQQSNVQNVGPFIVQIGGQPASVAEGAPLSGGVALPAAAAPLQAPAPAQAAGSGGIAGRVLDAAGVGLVGVPVQVTNAAGELLAVAVSRSNGVYLVPTGLATGQYNVTAKPRNDPAFALFADATATGVAVTEPALTTGVDLTLPAAGVLTGRVLGGAAGVGAVRVSAIGTGGTVVAADLTDATGAYSITHLPAGSYTLAFDPQATARSGLYARGALGAQAVTAGQVTSVADFTLPASATTGVIAGTVRDDTAQAGVGDVLVVVTRASPAQGETFVSVSTTEADGSYSSEPLTPGDYRVQFVTLFSEVVTTTRYIGELYNDAATYGDSDTLTVAAGASATADAGLALGGSIAGTVSGSGAGALADVIVIATDSAGVPRGFDLSDTSGAYSLSGLRAGDYTLEFVASLSSDSATRAFFDATYDANPATPAVEPVSLGAGAALTGVDIALGPGVQIVGTVSAGDTGEPLARVTVVFFEDLPGGQFGLAGVGQSDAAGAYSSPALGPGSYRVLYTTSFSSDATTRTYQDEYYSNKATLAEANAVLIGRQLGTVTRNADLAPGGAVRGRVSGSDSEAGLGGVFVVARAGASIVGGAISDEGGSYSLEGLPAGQLDLSFEPAYAPDPAVRGYSGATVSVSVSSGGETTQDVALTPAP